MNTLAYMTLADARLADPVKFDSIIREAVSEAARDVGSEVTIAALCNLPRTRVQQKAA